MYLVYNWHLSEETVVMTNITVWLPMWRQSMVVGDTVHLGSKANKSGVDSKASQFPGESFRWKQFYKLVTFSDGWKLCLLQVSREALRTHHQVWSPRYFHDFFSSLAFHKNG